MKPTSLRIAFLTPEFPTEISTAGGLSNYLGRICPTLVELGHEVEVFTFSKHPAGSLDYRGVLVHRVRIPAPNLLERAIGLIYVLWQQLGVSQIVSIKREARALAAALENRHQTQPFDVVQSSDYRLSGMCVLDRPERVHLVRCSSAGAILERLESDVSSLDTFWITHPESRWLRHVEHLYAPSRFVARYQQSRLDRPVEVIRPPFFLETEAQNLEGVTLPPRYLFHFGNINRVKGSDVLAEALEIVWKESPDLKMVWAGKLPHGEEFADKYPRLVAERERFTWLGSLQKPVLYGVLKKAVAVVAPSRCDNLPNNVLESLACGIPVIGSNGASIDELVTERINGKLVPIDDSTALARAMLQAWRGEPPFDGRTIPPLPEDLEPSRAAENLLEYVRLARSQSGSRQTKNETAQAVPA